MPDVTLPASRRRVLAALGGAATALTGGCLRRVRTLAGWQSSQQVRLRIKTLPADADPYALKVARAVAGWFDAAGVDAGVVPMAEQELLRQTLLRNEFDLFVMRLPPRHRDPDALYALLHSRYADAPGWRNPFGYADLDVDDLLDAQRRTDGADRADVLGELQRTIARTQPFTVLVVPDDVAAARTDRFGNWRSVDLASPLGYLSLARAGDDGETTLRLAVTDRRATSNLNPLSVEFRRDGILTGLMYDPLGYDVRGEVRPWLAEAWWFVRDDPPVARVTIREGVTWHDGESLTPADVAFTYDLLADTALGGDGGDDDVPVPSPRFGGRTSLVDEVTVVDDRTVSVRFADVHPAVAPRAFTVPILPEHVWGDRTDPAGIGGIDFGPVTEALVTNNIPPVGSGPLRFVRNTPRESLVLERFDDHFLGSESVEDGGLPGSVGPPAFERLSVQVVGTDSTAVELVADGEADVTATPVGARTVPRIGRDEALELLVDDSDQPYVLGYNVRRPHLNNPRVRRILASLIDGEHLAETTFQGYGRPAVGPLWGTRWYPAEFAWAEADASPVTPFLGSDGDVDVERARSAFREAGYRYDDDRLVGGNA